MMRMRVILVDDNKADSYYSNKIIRRINQSAEIISFASVEECLEFLKNNEQENLKAIFVDINMPGMDGWEFLNSYEKLPKQKRAEKIYLLTTSSNLKDITYANKYECNPGYLIKPIDEHSLNPILG